MESSNQGVNTIKLSHFTNALLNNFKTIKPKKEADEYSRIQVSQTASFFAIAYERIRNVVEYRENHLIRRAAIARILKRRLLLNGEGQGEGENLIRELLWARYFPPETLGQDDINLVQSIISKYLILIKKNQHHSEFLFELLTCEIEETLSPEDAQKNYLKTFYIFQVLKNKVKIENLDEEHRDIYFYIALEKIFNKSDLPYLRFHLFKLLNKSIEALSAEDMGRIDKLISNPYSNRLRRFVRAQIPPFKVLFELLEKHGKSIDSILQNREFIIKEVEAVCREKYNQTSKRLRSLAIKAIIYIFLTKMIFALILEYPLSLYLFGEVNPFSLTVNTVFPPILMFLIVGLTKVPGADNTQRVFNRLVDIIDADKSFETSVSYILKKSSSRRPTLIFFFTVFYSITFFATFFALYEILSVLKFNIISQVIFVFFVSLVAFFAYRIRQVAKEYKLQEKESFFRPFIDFFSLPFLSLGKFLSNGIAKLNFLTVFLDFLIEAPFKLIIEIVEEWINFIRARRDEIV